jgi:Spy/CpxP family protein refolding chaperone
MTKSLRRQLMAAALLLMCATPVLAQIRTSPIVQPPAPPFSWWKSEDSRRELGLTADQSARIDQIWQTTRPELRAEWDELERLESKLSMLIKKDADEASLARQIDRVETARANANKTRSLMLVQMMKVLTPDQRTRLGLMHDRYMENLQSPHGPQMPRPSAPVPSQKKPRE